jgi:iron complex outermembrane recepter protein
VKGVESDITWAATDHLTLSAAGTGLLRAQLTTTFCAPTCDGRPVFGCTDPAEIDAVAGTQLPITPKLKVNGTARYNFDVGDYKAFVQGAVIHQSSTTYSLEAIRYIVGDSPAFTTFDFSIGAAKDNWHAEVYVENAFDKRGDLGRL